MIDRTKIQVELLNLEKEGRILRLTDPQSGLSLEQRLDATQSLVGQKERLFVAFEAALAEVSLHAA